MAKKESSVLWFRKLAAVFLLSIFVLSITPVILLHDVFANHNDVCYHNFHQQGKQFSKADINCNSIFFVAEAQFLSSVSNIIIASPEHFFDNRTGSQIVSFFSQHHFYTELRGPPAIA